MGIGTTNPVAKLHVYGGITNFYNNSAAAGSLMLGGYSDVGGTYTKTWEINNDGSMNNTNTAYGGLSDERLKENIVDAPSYLEDLSKVRIVRYSLKENNLSEANDVGVLAQQMEQENVFTELVKDSSMKDGYKSVVYSKFVPILIKAVQELKAENDTLKARLDKAGL